ncbi:MAG: radical SAM protein [bacterium]|nr:radical SAM protein [bacterium]
MKITLIQPTIGRIGSKKLKRPWTLEPLAMAVLAGVTPEDIELKFYDDRIEDINYDDPTDLVGIGIETITALRGYEIARHYSDRGIPVVMGGVHATLLPEEVAGYADTVVCGHAEKLWPKIIEDFRSGKMNKFYSENQTTLDYIAVNRKIFSEKKYFSVGLAEFGRGCPFRCDFCDIPVYFKGKYASRKIDCFIDEIQKSKNKFFLVVDDNLGANQKKFREFCKAITPLGIKWASQTSITIAKNEDLLDDIARSGCIGFLVGFESTNAANLKQMNKSINESIPFDTAIRRFHERGIKIYGSFIVGYDGDTAESVSEMVQFAVEQKLFIANFQPLIPIPQTPLYNRLQSEGRLTNERWWLDYDYCYGDFVYRPARMTPEEMRKICEDAKRAFYGVGSIFARAFSSANSGNFSSASAYLSANIMTRKEVVLKNKTKLGFDKNLPHLLI